MSLQGNESNYTDRTANLVVDGLDEAGDFAGDGQCAPFVVFDVDSQANIAGPFLIRDLAEQHRLEILAGKPPRLDATALGQALADIDQGIVQEAVAPHMHEYGFDVMLKAAIRVKATSEI